MHRVQWKQQSSTGAEGGIREGEGALGTAVWGAAVSVAPAEGEGEQAKGGGGQDSSVEAGGLGGSVRGGGGGGEGGGGQHSSAGGGGEVLAELAIL